MVAGCTSLTPSCSFRVPPEGSASISCRGEGGNEGGREGEREGEREGQREGEGEGGGEREIEIERERQRLRQRKKKKKKKKERKKEQEKERKITSTSALQATRHSKYLQNIQPPLQNPLHIKLGVGGPVGVLFQAGSHLN